MTVKSDSVSRSVAATLVILAILLPWGGCRRDGSDAPQARFEMEILPSPPTVGDAQVNLRLTQPDGKPIEGAQLHVEGNMNHAGMKPVLADLKESEPGRYRGTLEFTMGGDWFLLVTAKMQDGRRLEHKIDVPGVKAR